MVGMEGSGGKDGLPPWARDRVFPWHFLHGPYPFIHSFPLKSSGSWVWLELRPGGQGKGMASGLEQRAGLQGDEGFVGA